MKRVRVFLTTLTTLLCLSCTRPPDPHTLVMIIESSPANLDPRIGTDGQSERIDMLLFDSLLRRDQHFDLQPSLAERWETAGPETYIFHLRSGVRFHDGRPLTARDVKWTIDSMLNGTVRSSKTSTYQYVASIETPDDRTVMFHLKEPDAALPWNLSDGAIGIVPYGSGPDFNRHPIGSGPFRFVSLQQDKEAVIERNPDYWDSSRTPRVQRVRFAVVPDTTTRVLELRKGSADIVINAFPSDMIYAMRRDPSLRIEQAPGSIYSYVAFNLRDPILEDVRVRRAIAYAMDRAPIIHYLWRDLAQPADSILPPQSWAFTTDVEHYPHDPARARVLLDSAGYRPAPGGIRFHLTMKISNTEESTRLFAAVLQQQLRDVGIALDIRTYEFATFYSDVVKGAFQLYSLRWIGGNQDPDIFEAVFASSSFPPRRFNRSYYSNPRVDSLIEHARRSLDQHQRLQDYVQIQKILSQDLPSIGLLYLDNVLVHTRRVRNLSLSPSGDYDFLTSAEIVP
ncbi:MAG TPA: ABC transporter substrate-binding protein [Terriglobales bacterium]|nr:ABC transporter substrate-binding protein [Terriglobales bacterium]